jgi:hypothetical protein
MSDGVMGVVTWVLVMIYCLISAFLTTQLPLVGTVLSVIAVGIVFWLMAVKGKAAS